MMQLFHRIFVVALCLTGLMINSFSFAQSYPNRPVKIIVAQAPGASPDVVARTLASKLSDVWKTSVIVENKPGANGNLGMDIVAKAPPDGYTLGLVVPSVMVINPFVYKNMPFKPLEDLAPITQVSSIIFSLVSNPQRPYQNVDELIAYAKKRPGEINYSSAGVGNLQHLAAELFSSKVGIKMNHIPNKGDSAALVDVMGGQTDIMFVPLPSAINQIKAGKLNLMALASKKRVSQFPNVPTMNELGQPDVLIEGWTGLVAPNGTPDNILEDIQKAVHQIIIDANTKNSIESQGFEVVGSTPKEFKQFLRQESSKWGGVIQKSAINLSN
ncbi:exported protein [Polynucleobacter sp. SHI8]|uniref:Bug family tripartite tricarboxylate transporter substrate binding protein n=1 Tax=unclassified Polynucleobacter TaxID=2640945 RepID=UPI002492EAEB|nr:MULTISPECIES: tripartite tricarboxylate transporter substrate binding protein [unclassified Polynucleobacter]BDW10354.1 exported protein [Polynucleobacter sp. SHI2]BDW12800.1 exported protein [Polynucleobacter sp. SHI8]